MPDKLEPWETPVEDTLQPWETPVDEGQSSSASIPAPTPDIPRQAPGLAYGPMGGISGLLTNPSQQPDQIKRDAVIAGKGVASTIPYVNKSVAGGIQPQNLGESLIYGSSATAATLPQIALGEGLVTKGAPALASSNFLPSVIRASLGFGGVEAAKGAIEGSEGDTSLAGRAKGTAEGFTHGASQGALGVTSARVGGKVLGTAAEKLLPGDLFKSIPIDGTDVLKNTPNIKAAIKHASEVVGEGLAAGLQGYLSAQDQPSYEQISTTLLQAGLGMMTGKQSPKEFLSKKPSTPEIPKGPGTAMVPASEARSMADPNVLAFIKLRSEQIFKQKKAHQTARNAESYLKHKLNPEKLSAVDFESLEGATLARELIQTAASLLNRGDQVGAEAALKRAEDIVNSQVRPALSQAFEKKKPLMAKESASTRTKRINSYREHLARIKEAAQVPDSILHMEAKDEATNEVIQKSLSSEIFLKGDAASAQIIDNYINGAEAKSIKLSPLEEAQLAKMLMEAGPLKTEGKTKDMVGVLNELDKFDPKGPWKSIIYDDILNMYNTAKEKHVKRVSKLRDDLQAAGFQVHDWTWFGAKYHKAFLKGAFGSWNPREESTLTKFIEGQNPYITPGQEGKYERGKVIVRQFFDEHYDYMREFLKTNGKEGYEYINDYIPWIRKTGFFDDVLPTPVQDTDQPSAFVKPKDKAFNFLFRPKVKPTEIVNLFTGMDTYARLAYESQVYDPMIKRARWIASIARSGWEDPLNPKAGIQTRGDIAKYFDRIAADLTNSTPYESGDVRPLRWWMKKGIDDHFYSNILATFKAGLNQIIQGAVVVGAPESEGRRLQVGGDIFHELFKSMFSNLAKSQFDISSQMFAEKMGSRIWEARKLSDIYTMENEPGVMGSFFHGVTSTMDEALVSSAFKTGYEFARRQQMDPEASRAYGDVFAARTQAVYYKVMKPEIIRGGFTKFLLPLSTSTFASMNSIRDTLDNPNLSGKQKGRNLGAYYASAVALGFIRNFFAQEPDHVISILSDAMFGTLPVIGSSIRYGQPAIPGVTGFILRYLSNPTTAKGLETAAIAFGPQGGYQVIRTLRGLKSVVESGAVRDKDHRIIYKYDPANLMETFRALAFGPSSTEAAAQEFTAKNPTIWTKQWNRLKKLIFQDSERS